MADAHNDKVREAYGRRALSYDASHGGWHAELANDFVKWIDPQPGETVLDLACGTGLVAMPMAERVGSQGKVVGVDLTSEMIEVGKENARALSDGAAKIEWLVGDIASEHLLDAAPIKEAVEKHGGFDIISVCSALVLLPDQPTAVKFWVDKLLKKGGRMIIDVTTEDMTLQFMMTYHLPVALGLGDTLSKGRLWVKGLEGPGSLRHLMESAGLEILQNFKTKGYLKEAWHEDDDKTAQEVLEHMVNTQYPYIREQGKLEEARKIWPGIWQQAVRQRAEGIGAVHQDHPLYICIGRRP